MLFTLAWASLAAMFSFSIALIGSDAPLLNQGLAVTAAILLVFVSVSVIYLSVIEWKDRRRMKR